MEQQTLSEILPQSDTQPLGFVYEAGGSGVHIALYARPSGQETDGGNFGDFVLVESGGRFFFGQITEIKLGSERTLGIQIADVTINRLGSVKLLATIDPKSDRVHNGLLAFPQIGDAIYSAPEMVVHAVGQGHKPRGQNENELKLSFARLASGSHLPLSFSPERIFGRHCAVLGATGGGKSWTVAKVAEECALVESKIILFDATGEYGSLSSGTKHVHFGHDEALDELSKEVSLPYYQLTENDLFAIFRPSGPSQAPKLRAAMKSLKLARLSPGLAPGGVIIKAHRPKDDYLQDYDSFIHDIEDPLALFDIFKLGSQIENECVNPQSSPTEPMVWGGMNSVDLSNCVPLVGRINDIIHMPGLAPLFNPVGTSSLLEEIEYFLEDRSKKVLCISLKNLSFAHHAREITVNAIARNVLDMARKMRFRAQPLVLIVDEAHQFLNEFIEQDGSAYTLNAFALIAKEGRKYWLTLCLATQRPRDIPESILSQMGTLVIHRLINDHDRGVVERASGELDRATASAIPGLVPGEAVLLGVDFPVPLRIKVDPPRAKPNSSGPNYQSHWRPRGRVQAKD